MKTSHLCIQLTALSGALSFERITGGKLPYENVFKFIPLKIRSNF